jgi:hypothetical protein
VLKEIFRSSISSWYDDTDTVVVYPRAQHGGIGRRDRMRLRGFRSLF